MDEEFTRYFDDSPKKGRINGADPIHEEDSVSRKSNSSKSQNNINGENQSSIATIEEVNSNLPKVTQSSFKRTGFEETPRLLPKNIAKNSLRDSSQSKE